MLMVKRYLLLGLLLLPMVTLSSEEPKKQTFTLYSNQVEGSVFNDWLSEVYRELYARLGFQLEIVSVPEARASVKAESGSIDGQFGRIYEYQNFYPDQLRIDVPLYKISKEAYVRKDSGIKLVHGWKSFAGLELYVEYRRGVLVSQQNLEKYVEPSYLSSVTQIEQGFLKLKNNRTDVFVHANIGAYPFVYSPEFENTIVSAGTMEIINMYPYVHKSHRKLVPQIEATLLKMINDGVVEQYCKDIVDTDGRNLCETLLVLDLK